MKKVLIFILLFISTTSVICQQRKDTIYLLNGSKIVGEIDKIQLGVISFDPDDANDITVQLPKLKNIAAVRTVFRIETVNNKVYYGRLLPYSVDRYALLVEAADTILIDIQEISLLYPFKNSFLKRFAGSLGGGLTYTRTNDLGQINFNGKLNYTSKRDEISLSTSGIYSITDTTFTRDREDIFLKNNFYIDNKWFLTLLASYQRNQELGLLRRFQEGLGAGNKFITTKHVYSWARSGMVLNQEKNIEGVSTGTLAELFTQLEFHFFRFTKPEVNFVLADAFYYSLSQSGRFRDDGEMDLYWEIFKDFKLDLTYYMSFDSKPPGLESRTYDFGIVFGLSFSF
jgi:hypothetical protein